MSRKVDDLEKALTGMISQVRRDLDEARRELNGIDRDGLRKSNGGLREQMAELERRIEIVEKRQAASPEEPPPLQADTFIHDAPLLLQ